MASSSEGYHVPYDKLTARTVNYHYAAVSLEEELEATDWYRQRADACEDPALKEILLHNMREEIEHACMLLEWLRRNDEHWAENLNTYLFTDAPITAVEEAIQSGEAAGGGAAGRKGKSPQGFTVGSLRKGE